MEEGDPSRLCYFSFSIVEDMRHRFVSVSSEHTTPVHIFFRFLYQRKFCGCVFWFVPRAAVNGVHWNALKRHPERVHPHRHAQHEPPKGTKAAGLHATSRCPRSTATAQNRQRPAGERVETLFGDDATTSRTALSWRSASTSRSWATRRRCAGLSCSLVRGASRSTRVARARRS